MYNLHIIYYTVVISATVAITLIKSCHITLLDTGIIMCSVCVVLIMHIVVDEQKHNG